MISGKGPDTGTEHIFDNWRERIVGTETWQFLCM